MSSKWGFHHLSVGSNQYSVSPCLEPTTQPNVERYASPQGAKVVKPILEYDARHFLGLPLEIRQHLWRFMTNETSDNPQWFRRQENQLVGLLLTCRQVYHELEAYHRRFDVPWHRLCKFLSAVPLLNEVNIRQFKALSLEVRLDAHPGYFLGLAHLLHKTQPFLKQLQLYFIGPDRYGTRTFLHGCGNIENEKSEQGLPIDGQHFHKFLPLWQRIMLLRRLEVMVISNANLQIYQTMFLENKPYLEYVHLSTDPRAVIHTQHNFHDLGRLLGQPERDAYPPVKALHIAANSTLSSVQIAAKLGEHLEHLTWVVPDPSLSLGGMRIPWYDHTAYLMDALHLRAPKLKTLRLCVAGAGLYEGHHEYGRAMGSIKSVLPNLRHLRHFELHMKSKSDYFGKELIYACSPELEHIYLSDRIIHPWDLMVTIWERFLATDTLYPRYQLARANTIHYIQQVEAFQICHTSTTKLPLEDSKGPWFISLNPVTYYGESIDTKRIDGQFEDEIVICRHKPASDLEYLEGCIGEDMHRQDHIPFWTGHLRFVHFEYDHSTDPLLPSTYLTPIQILLYVNGRLLDRARNSHLAKLGAGSHIKVKMDDKRNIISHAVEESATQSSHLAYSVLLHNLYEIECLQPRDIVQAMDELNSSPFTDNIRYFGHELEAQRVFDREPVASAENMEPLRYVVEKEVLVDGKCHWSCAEARLPSMHEREETWKERNLNWKAQNLFQSDQT